MLTLSAELLNLIVVFAPLFSKRTRPGSAGWEPIARLAPDVKVTEGIGVRLAQWALGCAMIYFSLFGVGSMIFGQYLLGTILLALAFAAGAGIFIALSRKTEDDLWEQEMLNASEAKTSD